MKIKKDLETYSVNHLYFIFNKVNRHFKEINETLVPTNESKEKIKNMENYGVKSEILLDQ